MSTPVEYIPIVAQIPAPAPDFKIFLPSQTTAITVITVTVGSSDTSYDITPYLSSTSFTSGSLSYTLSYTNEFGQPQSIPLFTATAVGLGLGITFQIRAKAGSTLTFATSGTFTATYNVGARARQAIP